MPAGTAAETRRGVRASVESRSQGDVRPSTSPLRTHIQPQETKEPSEHSASSSTGDGTAVTDVKSILEFCKTKYHLSIEQLKALNRALQKNRCTLRNIENAMYHTCGTGDGSAILDIEISQKPSERTSVQTALITDLRKAIRNVSPTSIAPIVAHCSDRITKPFVVAIEGHINQVLSPVGLTLNFLVQSSTLGVLTSHWSFDLSTESAVSTIPESDGDSVDGADDFLDRFAQSTSIPKAGLQKRQNRLVDGMVDIQTDYELPRSMLLPQLVRYTKPVDAGTFLVCSMLSELAAQDMRSRKKISADMSYHLEVLMLSNLYLATVIRVLVECVQEKLSFARTLHDQLVILMRARQE
jgi:hypothetical protein